VASRREHLVRSRAMNDRRGDDHPDRGTDQRDGRGGPNGDAGRDADQRGRDGSDTQFLQLEMSRVLYEEARGVTKQALRELLLDAAKDHLRKRFGEAITRLGELATEELLSGIEASLDIEDQIQRRQESSGGTPDRLREALARSRSARREAPAERKEGRASASRKRRR
jgi:hypothetical protein